MSTVIGAPVTITSDLQCESSSVLTDITTPEGLRVITAPGAAFSDADLHAIYRFRLDQYRARGWVNTSLVDRRGIDAEPYGRSDAEQDLHTVVVDRSLTMRGYGTLTGAVAPMPLSDPNRRRLVLERDYALRLTERLSPSTHVGEGKRLIRDYAMPRSVAGASIPWWVYLAWGRACSQLIHSYPEAAVVGDGKLDGAIAQLRLLGFTVTVLEGTPVAPAAEDLFAPMWDQTVRSHPFVLTDENGALDRTLDLVESILRSGDPTGLRRKLSDAAEVRQ